MTATIWDVPGVVESLRSFYDDNLSMAQIANALWESHRVSTTRNAVIGKCRRMKFPPRACDARQERQRNVNPTLRKQRRLKFRGRSYFRFQDLFEPVDITTNVIDDTMIPLEQRKTLLQLESCHCRWPVGEPGTAEFFFCGGVAVEGKPYCLGHLRRAWRPPNERKKRQMTIKTSRFSVDAEIRQIAG